MLAVKGLTVVVLLLVCWEDLRHRAVHWSLFPLTGLLLGAPAYLGRSHAAWLADLGMNALFLLVQAVALVVNGFCREVLQQLPMEFAVEAQKLVGISLEGSVG